MTVEQFELYHFLAQEQQVAEIEWIGKSVAVALVPLLRAMLTPH